MSNAILFDSFAKGKQTAMQKGNRCVIYTRVSTKEQADNNLSLETQRKASEQFAQKNNYIIMGYFGGTYESAKTDERKEFNNMLSFVKKSREKISYIIVYSVDRFSRSGANAIYIADQLKQQGVTIISVTQPTDTSTSSGSLQQNIQFIFSEYDNQLRREKCIAGTKEKLLRGEWVQKPPLGYDTIRRNGQRFIQVNEKGELLRKAFLWKANEQLSNVDVQRRLASMGMKLSHQMITKIFQNPFYCGYLSHNFLEGKVIAGKHEKLISEEIFLKVNEVQSKNHHGYKTTQENNDIPLKRFLKCDCCGTFMRGYIVKKKKIHYYKCGTPGCKNNKSARELHKVFRKKLGEYNFDIQEKHLIKTQMIATYNQNSKEQIENEAQLSAQLSDISKKIERLEERYVTEEISKDLFEKYKIKYTEEKAEIQRQLAKFGNHGSNLLECVDDALSLCRILPELWDFVGYNAKQRLQFLLFPSGMRYNKKTDECRTEEENEFAIRIPNGSKSCNGNENKNGATSCNVAPSVLGTGIERVLAK